MFGKPFWPKPRRRPRPRKSCLSWSRARRAPEPKASPSRPRRPRTSLPVVALYSIEPGPLFPGIHPYVTRGNEEGRPEQEDTPSSPSTLMELKFELGTQLTVSCVVAVASAYGLVTVSIAMDSVLLAFGNAVILLLILFVLFG